MAQRLQHRSQHKLTTGPRHQLCLGPGKLDDARDQVDAVRALHNGVPRRDTAPDQHLVDTHLDRLRVNSEAEGQAGLRVEVDQQHPLAELGERCPQRGDRRRLGHPALLVGHGHDRGQARGRRLVGFAVLVLFGVLRALSHS